MKRRNRPDVRRCHNGQLPMSELSAEQVEYLMANGLRRITRRDPSLPHQIVMLARGGKLIVSCHCLARENVNGSVTHQPIGWRWAWPPGTAMACWRKHFEAVTRQLRPLPDPEVDRYQ